MLIFVDSWPVSCRFWCFQPQIDRKSTWIKKKMSPCGAGPGSSATCCNFFYSQAGDLGLPAHWPRWGDHHPRIEKIKVVFFNSHIRLATNECRISVEVARRLPESCPKVARTLSKSCPKVAPGHENRNGYKNSSCESCEFINRTILHRILVRTFSWWWHLFLGLGR